MVIKMKENPKLTYDRKVVGERIRNKRTLLGVSREGMAKQIGCAVKYYGDIERGSCGMSVETLMALSSALNMPLDDIIYGAARAKEEMLPSKEAAAVFGLLNAASKQNQEYAVRMLKLFLSACD